MTTRKGDKLYVHVLESEDEGLYLTLEAAVKSARCLNDDRPVKFETLWGKGIVIHLQEIPQATGRIIELTLR